MAYFETKLGLQQNESGFEVSLRTPWNFDYTTEEPMQLTITTLGGDTETITVVIGQIATQETPIPATHNGILEVAPGDTVSVSYGYGYYAHAAEVTVE